MSLPVQAVGAAASLAKTQNGKVTVLLVDVQEPGLEEATTRSEALAWQFREAGFEHFEILSKVGKGSSPCCCGVQAPYQHKPEINTAQARYEQQLCPGSSRLQVECTTLTAAAIRDTPTKWSSRAQEGRSPKGSPGK